MEEGYLEEIQERIQNHIMRIKYDNTPEFEEFKRDIMTSLTIFMNDYEENKRMLERANIIEGNECRYSEYLERLKGELINLLSNEPDTNSVEKVKHHVEVELSIFLNPRTYIQNTIVLKKVQESKQGRQKTYGPIDKNPFGC